MHMGTRDMQRQENFGVLSTYIKQINTSWAHIQSQISNMGTVKILKQSKPPTNANVKKNKLAFSTLIQTGNV